MARHLYSVVVDCKLLGCVFFMTMKILIINHTKYFENLRENGKGDG